MTADATASRSIIQSYGDHLKRRPPVAATLQVISDGRERGESV